MKILVGILLIAVSCSALPSPGIRSKKEVAPGSANGSNLLETTTENVSALSTTSKSANVTDTTTVKDHEASLQVPEKPSNKSEETNKLHPSNVPIVQSRILPDLESTIALHSDEFKVRILDLSEPTKQGQKKDSEISIGLPTYQGGSQTVKFPEVIVVKIPHYVIVKESDFLNNRHYDIPSISEPFHPFQEIPSLTQDFSRDGSLLGFPGTYPIELPQEVGQYPIIGGGSPIPTIPDFGGISQGGIEILQPQPITIGLNQEQIDHEADSVTVEALDKLASPTSLNESKISTNKNETNNEQKPKDKKQDSKNL